MHCEDWLKDYMSDGELHLSSEVRHKAKVQGYSKSELREARKKLGVKVFHQFDEFGDTGNWFWYAEV